MKRSWQVNYTIIISGLFLLTLLSTTGCKDSEEEIHNLYSTRKDCQNDYPARKDECKKIKFYYLGPSYYYTIEGTDNSGVSSKLNGISSIAVGIFNSMGQSISIDEAREKAKAGTFNDFIRAYLKYRTKSRSRPRYGRYG
jgi:hypothetical protein